MGNEIDLLSEYPKAPRDVKERAESKTEADRQIARQFGKEFFDGDRRHGYGGFEYHPRFWTPVVPRSIKEYDLAEGDKLLDVGCAKGFMLHDFCLSIPGLRVAGVDVSEYAVRHAKDEVKNFLQVSDARCLPYGNNSFDLVVSINTVHNLEYDDVIKALKEIQRVSANHAFVTVDAYRNDREKQKMFDWNLTAKTILSVGDWKELFYKAGYTGDFFWFTP